VTGASFVPRVVRTAQERDGQDDEAEHQPEVARLEAGAQDQPEAGHGNARERHEGQNDPPVQPDRAGRIPFFPQRGRRVDLELVETRTFSLRVVYLHYRVTR
jgi:hypothetical protein